MTLTLSTQTLTQIHEQYVKNVPNSYEITVGRIAKAVNEQDLTTVIDALERWLKDLNRQYYRFRPQEARNLKETLEPLIKTHWKALLQFRQRSFTTVTVEDKGLVTSAFDSLRAKLGPIGAAKALHVLAPTFLPMWDNAIASGYGVSTESGYFQFVLLAKEELRDISEDAIPGVPLLKAFDEYNYYRFSTPAKQN